MRAAAQTGRRHLMVRRLIALVVFAVSTSASSMLIPESARGLRMSASVAPLVRPSPLAPLLTALEVRADSLEARADALRKIHDERVAPLEAALRTRSDADTTHLTRIAIALVREGDATHVDPRLLLAVLLVENPWLDPKAQSSVGAVGLMQVMPFHAGAWGCRGNDLEDLDQNICHGARILAAAIRRSGGDLDQALLRYNGCVSGTNTPDCHAYPSWVYGRAGPDWMSEIAAPGALAAQIATDLQM